MILSSSNSQRRTESTTPLPGRRQIPEETELRYCAEDTELTKSFHDRVGIQDSLLNPLGNLVALPGCGRGGHHSVELHQAARRPRLWQKQPREPCARSLRPHLAIWCPPEPSSPPGTWLTQWGNAEFNCVLGQGTCPIMKWGAAPFGCS